METVVIRMRMRKRERDFIFMDAVVLKHYLSCMLMIALVMILHELLNVIVGFALLCCYCVYSYSDFRVCCVSSNNIASCSIVLFLSWT